MRTFAVSALFAAIALADGHMPTNSTDHHDDHHMEEGHMDDMEKMMQLEEMIHVFCKGMDMNHEDWTDDDHSGDEHSDDDHSDPDTTDHEGMHRNLAGHGDHDEKDWETGDVRDHGDWDKDHGDWDKDHDKDHDKEMDHGHVKDMWLCMQAKQMHWDLNEYHMGGER